VFSGFAKVWTPVIPAVPIDLCPIDKAHTRLTVVASRDFLKSGLLEGVFSAQNARIADENRAVVESSFPSEVPPPGVEHSVATDRATLKFRRYYYEALKGSEA